MKVYGSIAAIVISLSFLWVGADARVGGAVKVLDDEANGGVDPIRRRGLKSGKFMEEGYSISSDSADTGAGAGAVAGPDAGPEDKMEEGYASGAKKGEESYKISKGFTKNVNKALRLRLYNARVARRKAFYARMKALKGSQP
jgi:hypothetical protein